MANAALFVGWGDVKTGREKLAGELFNATVAFFTDKTKDGTLESFEPVILYRHGGDLNGFFLLRGDQDKLDAFRRTDAYKDWNLKAVHCLDGFGVVEGYLGDGITDIMQRWGAAIPG